MPFSELFKAQRASRSKGLPYGMQEIGPENLLNKEARRDKDQLSKIMARAETLKKIHRQRTSKKKVEIEEPNDDNNDILDDDYLRQLTEKVKKKMKFAQTSDNIKIETDKFDDALLELMTSEENTAGILSNNMLSPSSSMQTRKDMQSRFKKQRQSAVHFSRQTGVQLDSQSNTDLNGIARQNYSPPKTAQGQSRKRDFNRFSHFNPTNDRQIRLSRDFSQSRGFVQSPQIMMPQRTRESSGLRGTFSETRIASSYVT